MTIQVQSVTPTAGSVLGQDQPLIVNMRSSVAFIRILIAVSFPGIGITELVYAQDPAGVLSEIFEQPYGTSTIEAITDVGWFHYQFTIQRSPVWPSAPKIEIWAFNTAAEEL